MTLRHWPGPFLPPHVTPTSLKLKWQDAPGWEIEEVPYIIYCFQTIVFYIVDHLKDVCGCAWKSLDFHLNWAFGISIYGNSLPTRHRSSSTDSGYVTTHAHRGVCISSPTQLKQLEFRFVHIHCNVARPLYPSIKLLPNPPKMVFSSSPWHFQTFQY